MAGIHYTGGAGKEFFMRVMVSPRKSRLALRGQHENLGAFWNHQLGGNCSGCRNVYSAGAPKQYRGGFAATSVPRQIDGLPHVFADRSEACLDVLSAPG